MRSFSETDMLMANDKAIMLAIKDGDVDQLAVLFEKYHVALLHYFVRMGNNQAVSEDLVQETFLRVLKYKASYLGDNQFSSWLYRIARNAAIDFHRKPAQRNHHETYEESDHAGDENLSDQMTRSQQQDHFQQALASIEPAQRELIVLSRFQQLKYEEIAELLECNLNTLKTRIRAALANLKQQYELISGASQ